MCTLRIALLLIGILHFSGCQMQDETGTSITISTFSKNSNQSSDKIDFNIDENLKKKTNQSQSKGNQTFLLEIFPKNLTYPGRTRQPKILFPKIHSGASFLAGLKIGSILSKKGFELGHGKIASAHSFQLFGKTINKATSLSYGNSLPLLPTLDDAPSEPSNENSSKDSLKKSVFSVAVIEKSPNHVLENSKDTPLKNVKEKELEEAEDKENARSNETHEKNLRVYQIEEVEKVKKKDDQNFLKEHNNFVKEYNNEILQRLKD